MKEQVQGNAGYLGHFPIANRIRRRIDYDVGEIGFQQTVDKIANLVGENKLVIKGKDEETKDVLRRKPAIVIANHPSFAEIIAVIASLEPRDDIHLVGISNFLGIGANFSERVIPIYMTKQMAAKKHKFPVRLGNALHFGPRMPYDKAHKKNIGSIESAIEKVNNEGLVVIFPEGVQSGKDKKWLDGVGHLIAGVESRSSVHLIFVYSKGTSNWDYMRVVPGVKKLLPKIEVTFSKPRTIADFLGGITDPKLITKKMEHEYNNYVDSIIGH
ncbi:MAG: 1-acyl-sn-glycerol-3-phosphate acyltransferase [Candidatus Levybacteria bacterium]|nr:1-acyl-sn-glycerol-3-phosphate acyltransferase [Candidatus Levybacteria bacterium]